MAAQWLRMVVTHEDDVRRLEAGQDKRVKVD